MDVYNRVRVGDRERVNSLRIGQVYLMDLIDYLTPVIISRR